MPDSLYDMPGLAALLSLQTRVPESRAAVVRSRRIVA